jgi:hypothetical protein
MPDLAPVLSGDVRVNSKPVLSWEAQRLRPLDDANQEHEYGYRVTDDQGNLCDTGTLPHLYRDGVTVLAIKVLWHAVETQQAASRPPAQVPKASQQAVTHAQRQRRWGHGS